MSLLDEDTKSPINWTLATAIIALIAVIAAVGWIMLTAKSYDKVTLCEKNIKSPLTVVLFDKTGGFSENQKRLIKKAIDKEITDLKTGARLTVYEIDAQTMEGLSAPIFDKCKPRDGSDANSFYENNKLMTKKFEKQFASIVTEVTDTLITAENAPSSPLLESLQDLASLSSLNGEVELNKIVLLSDLLQHSDSISFYNNSLKDADFDKALPMVPDLFGTDIQLYWLLRKGKEGEIQNANLIPWWERILEEAGVSNLNVMKVR
ncbi:hypothetical protein [uncultured Alteromonas sp.]|uniref:hypothetical protein n=1 Tax=uncultured Alteromonas sp. TaxID=179113 RepID=UPI0030CFF8B3|tara:strand:+ start:2190 stop:2978 length:789 start_codon:yes stop_codon:yes gene_type:complete